MTALLIMIAGLSIRAGDSSGFSTTFSSGMNRGGILRKDRLSISAGSAERRSGLEAMAGG